MAAAPRGARRQTEYEELLQAEARLTDQLDTMQRISRAQKNDQLGKDFFKEVREFYTLVNNATTAPVFRPRVSVPELQILGIKESIEVTDIQPQIYLCKNLDSLEQDNIAESALRAQWRDCGTNLNLMLAELSAWFCGTSFMQVGYDANRRFGRGDVTAVFRDPETVFPDPYATDETNMQFCILEDFYWKDEVKRLWPEQADRIRGKRMPRPDAGMTSAAERAGLGLGLEVPSGPMQMMTSAFPTTSTPGDARFRVRTAFIKDGSVVKVAPDNKVMKLETEGIAKPTYKLRYPRGRMIIECEGVVLYDGDNPRLDGEIPIVRFIGMPSLYGFWAPPPVRYTKDIQTLAERFYTQLFENAIRTNNGVWFVSEATGIDPERFGGLPGEVQMMNANSEAPTLVFPGQMPQQMFALPDVLLALQRRLQGFPDERQGKVAAGNVSAPLFEGAIAQSHVVTRGRARLMYPGVQRLAWLMFSTMGQYYTSERKFVDFKADGIGHVDWKPIDRQKLVDYGAFLDPASLQPMSAVVLRNMVPMLRNLGLLDVATALDMLTVPNRQEVLKRLQEEAKMAAQNAAIRDEQKAAHKSSKGVKSK